MKLIKNTDCFKLRANLSLTYTHAHTHKHWKK